VSENTVKGQTVASRPRLLDLFCCAGGAAMGYHRAGFDVVGVDIKPQPRYPFEFVQRDAIEVLDAVHASPPCQSYTPLRALHPDKTYPDLVDATRARLDQTGLPYIIENVMTAPLIKEKSIVLCGAMFGLRAYRHRRFESNVDLCAPAHPKHVAMTATSRRRERWDAGWNVSITGDVGTYLGLEAMGIDWMNGNELCEAIPPPYAENIGCQIINSLTSNSATVKGHSWTACCPASSFRFPLLVFRSPNGCAVCLSMPDPATVLG
jgi:DNA (cytosine-5)-methyltransferase 1